MTFVSPPGLTRTAANTPRHLLDHRIKVIDRRRSLIEAQLLAAPGDGSYKAQELQAELAALNNMRFEAEALLHPNKSARSPELQRVYDRQHERDKQLLRSTIRQQTEQVEANAEREERAGNHRQARLLRMEIPALAERVCKEFGKDPALLAELDEASGPIPRRRYHPR